MSFDYVDISDIVKRLDDLFINHVIDGEKRKCQYCGKIKNIIDFHQQVKGNRSRIPKLDYTYCCTDCWDEHVAEKGIWKTIDSFLEKTFDETNDSNGEKKRLARKSFSENLTPDIIKLKIILNKLNNKIKNYDASKQ